MSLKFGKIVPILSQIPIENVPIATARTHKGIGPRYGAYPTIMSGQCPRHFALLSVPNLKISRLCSHSEGGPITGPLHTRDSIIGPNVAQLCHFAIRGIPHVNAGAKTHSEGVLGGPIHQIEVEIILQKGRI